ncbi:MAG: SIS domain-containing protein [Longicatena sp.]
MKQDGFDVAFEVGLGVVNKIKNTQKEAIKKAGRTISEAHRNGKTFYVSGSGHSHGVAEELYGRAGGLAFSVPILTSELTLTEHPTKSTFIERLAGYATILVDLYKIGEGDVVLIASNSGRNAYPVELAIEAKKRGAKVIAMTSMAHSTQVSSRDKSGKRLFEVADIVIDTCGEVGDSATYIDGIDVPILPTSSIANAFICASITAEVVCDLTAHNCEVEVLVSANVDGGYEKNEKYMEKYCRMYIKK